MATPRSVYPISLLLEGARCLVVGGGELARGKAAALVDAGAQVVVVAPSIAEDLAALATECWRRPYRPGDAAGFRLALAATGLEAVDAAVFEDGERLGTLVNAADLPNACAFYLPAILRRGPVTVAVSTGGASPALAAVVRDRIAAALGPHLERLVELVGAARAQLRSAGRSSEGAPWRELIDSLEAALEQPAGDPAASEVLDAWLAARHAETPAPPTRRPGGHEAGG